MAELRKIIKLNKYTFGVTFPPKYLKALGLIPGDFVEISLETKDKLLVEKHFWNKK